MHTGIFLQCHVTDGWNEMTLLQGPPSPKLLPRIMDCFLSEGIETIFRLALTLLMMGKHELLLLDMEGVIKYFQKEMPKKFDADQEAVFSMAFLIKINQKKMRRLEKEYTTMKSKEKEDEIELRVSAFVAFNSKVFVYSACGRRTGYSGRGSTCWRPRVANWRTGLYRYSTARQDTDNRASQWPHGS